MEKKVVSDFCELYLYDDYAIVRIFENQHLDIKKNDWIRQQYKDHFGNKEFVVVADRRFPHSIDLDIYKNGKMRNKKGLAIVSTIEEERERAYVEQKLFPYSFALFGSLEDAKSWAQHFF
ncbi:hypothetical protein EI546_02750 [Aequorivita sp. H23M31]|uniref:STAS/SEC14 domain-containing protein n=1 Tax=Aequorivita ciconiae TaxID=2494375 RepID=A0A410G0F2_9FLAO|nr:hypothetical protein [Aequorivita sp. H23M31]QAA80711.1 hypothetical protein EI546_02750 [Aequorivita sp. H23M31]